MLLGRLPLAVTVCGVLLTTALHAQNSGAMSIRAARLHQATTCTACGLASSDLGASLAGRLDWEIVGGVGAGVEGQLSSDGDWTTVALLVGVGSDLRRPGPWIHLAAGTAIVPGECDYTVNGAVAPASLRLTSDTGPFDVRCGHDARGALALRIGLQAPARGLRIGPELGALITTQRRRFSLLEAGLSIRF